MTKEEERLSAEAIENKRRYNAEYIKTHYVRKSVSLPKEEYEKYQQLLKKNNLTAVNFIRLAMKQLEEGKIKRD